MDPTEDLSARVLLRHILSTEPPRTPITRSVTKAQSLSVTRRSSRLSNKDNVGQTPQDLLRRNLRQKMRESITTTSLPATKRRTAVKRESNTAALMSFDDGGTPRHILKNILMTEPVRSPVVHRKTEAEEPQPFSANSSLTGKNTSTELSGLDLPDLTMGIAPTVTKGLSRKRQRQSLNVTAFEKRLKGGDDVGEESELWANEHSSLSLSGSTSLSLKTPFADVQTEKRGLQRRVSNRRKITEEAFGAAVNRIEMGGMSSFVGLGPSDTCTEGLTLGLSTFSEPDITTDIVQCDTDRDTRLKEESTTRSHYKEEESARDSQTEESDGDPQPEVDVSTGTQSQEEEEEEEGGAQESHKEEECGDPEPEVEVSTASQSQEEEEEEEGAQESHKEEECGDPEPEVEVSTGSQSQEEEEEDEEEEEGAQKSHSEEECGDPEPEVEVFTGSQSQEEEEEEGAQQSHSEEECGDPEPEVEAFTGSQSQEEEEEEDAQESHTANSQTKDLNPVDCQADEEEEDFADDERGHKNSPEEDLTHSEAELEEHGDGRVSEEHEAHCSGGVAVHATETDGDASDTGCSEDESKAKGTFILPITLGMGDSEADQPLNDFAESSTTGQPDVEYPEDLVDKENCSEDGRRHDSPAEGAADDSDELEDEEEREDVPSKTPAFVRKKRVFSQPFDHNVQPSGPSKSSPAKSKQVRKPPRPRKRQEGLPKSYLMNVFKHFAKTKVSADVYPVLNEVMDKFFERLAEDLETYAAHAKRKTIDVEDAKLLLKRQGHVSDKVPVEVLIEKYLRLEQRKLLIPIATSGNVVIPKK
ncbi:centromere protein T isoform X2 [Takifugu flavidus]|uniref:Centromere protein T n=1 Tax=Takifugu flavidus TaxID=433684 RepID=A0A5C6PRE2_9TELE|nr:centromere protein T isoform X2 [Takifugu flavidus]TWW81291.1 Centromere protein T [Takifugu flavidus]